MAGSTRAWARTTSAVACTPTASINSPRVIGPPSLRAVCSTPSISMLPHGKRSLVARPARPTSSRRSTRLSTSGTTSSGRGGGGSTRRPSGVWGNNRNAPASASGAATHVAASTTVPTHGPCSAKAVATPAPSATTLRNPSTPPEGTNTSSTIMPRPTARSATIQATAVMRMPSAARRYARRGPRRPRRPFPARSRSRR